MKFFDPIPEELLVMEEKHLADKEAPILPHEMEAITERHIYIITEWMKYVNDNIAAGKSADGCFDGFDADDMSELGHTLMHFHEVIARSGEVVANEIVLRTIKDKTASIKTIIDMLKEKM